jgi:hypothetical protein
MTKGIFEYTLLFLIISYLSLFTSVYITKLPGDSEIEKENEIRFRSIQEMMKAGFYIIGTSNGVNNNGLGIFSNNICFLVILFMNIIDQELVKFFQTNLGMRLLLFGNIVDVERSEKEKEELEKLNLDSVSDSSSTVSTSKDEEGEGAFN